MTPQKKWLRDQSWMGRVRRLWWGSRLESGLTELLPQQTTDLELPEKLLWLEQLLHWLFGPGPEQVETRFRFLFQVLERNPEWRINFERTWIAILEQGSWLHFYTQIGIAVDYGLWADLAARISDRLVPTDPGADVQAILARVFCEPERVDALAALSPDTVARAALLLRPAGSEAGWERVRVQALESTHALATHIAHYGLGAQIRSGLPQPDRISGISFFRLLDRHHHLPGLDELTACERDIARAYANLEHSGVSVDVVNRLETLSALVERVRHVRALLSPGERSAPPESKPTPAPAPSPEDSLTPLSAELADSFASAPSAPGAALAPESDAPAERLHQLHSFAIEVAAASYAAREVLGPLRRHFYLLSRKIVERNGQSAEHYIAYNAKEMSELFRSAMLGGAIVVAMTIAKTWLVHFAPAPLFLATGIWIIYAAGFLAMQFTGGTLATKIPSYTASRLAALFKSVSRSTRDEFRKELRSTVRSQTVALIGNIAGLVPLVVILDLVGRAVTGKTFFDLSYARYWIQDLHPFLSFVIPLGALTGVQLWLSSVVGGWLENWVVYRRLPETIRHHSRLRQIFGHRSAEKLSEWVSKHASGIGSNVSLGFLFGFVPLLGAVIGTNWNGHHVTISSASAVFALSAFDFEAGVASTAWAMAGIFLIGLMNFGVSFGLALFIAANAQRVRFRRVVRYLRATVRTPRARRVRKKR